MAPILRLEKEKRRIMKVLNIKNFYGISELNGTNLFTEGNNTIIYAPNGVMKSSFSDGISDLSNGKKPRDAYYNLESNFDIRFENKIFNHENVTENNKLNAVVYSGANFSDLALMEKRNPIVASTELRVKYLESKKKVDSSIEEIKNCLKKHIFDKEKISMANEKIFNHLIASESFDIASLSNLEIEKSDMYDTHIKLLNDIDIPSIFNEDVEKSAKAKKTRDKIKEFIEVKNQKYTEELSRIFKGEFDIFALNNINELLKKSEYYQVGHTLCINGKKYDETGINELIDSTKKSVYADKEVIELTNEVTALLAKNNANRNLNKFIEKEPELILGFDNYDKFKRDAVYHVVRDEEKNIKTLKEVVAKETDILKGLNLELLSEKKVWEEIVDDFNNRFTEIPYLVKIVDKLDTKTGMRTPSFTKEHKVDGVELNENVLDRFSTGEKRSLHILNLMYDVQVMRTNLKLAPGDNEPFIVVLDDIAESFDYSNKFAIIEYINDLLSSNDARVILLTHNFDFYRSIILSSPYNSVKNRLLAYKEKPQDGDERKSIIQLYKAPEGLFTGREVFNDWKKRNSIMYEVSLIPMMRNLSSYSKGREDGDYDSMTKYLHYTGTTENLTMEEYIDVITRFELDSIYTENLLTENGPKKYMDVLDGLLDEILSNGEVKETDIEKKLALAIIIRIYSDKYLWKKHIVEYSVEPIICEFGGTSKRIMTRLKDDSKISEDIQKIITEAFIIAPTFVHLNGFMVEPLVDIGAHRMVSLADELRTLLT